MAALSGAIAVQAAQAPPTSALFDAGQLLKDLQTLSADDMQGRQVGTPGSAKARAYIVERFKAAGLSAYRAVCTSRSSPSPDAAPLSRSPA